MAPKKTNKPKTPQPMKGAKPAGLKATPKSAPPSKKKKKLEEAEDDDFDEEDLEMLLAGAKKKLMAKGGIKGTPKSNGKAKGGSEGDDDDDSDMDDDDDIDEEDDSDMDDEDDDDMDEDDSDDDDEEDDDDDTEEDNEVQIKQIKQEKQKKVKQEAPQTPKQKPQTPKQEKKKPEVKNEKKQTPGKQVKKEPVSSPAKRKAEEPTTNFSKEDLRRKKEMDNRTLFVKNLPSNVTDKELKDLSGDIKEVRIRMSYRRGTKTRGFAYIVFESEKAAEKNHKALSGKKIREKEVMVDFVGEKSSRAKPENLPPRGELDPCKLYVTGFGVDMTEEEFEKMFPTASAVTFPMKSKTNLPLGYGFVFFSTPEEAKAVHDQMANKQVKGKRLVVLFAKKSAHKPGQKKPKSDKKKSKDAASPAKKAKLTQKVEEEDDDDDDDDDIRSALPGETLEVKGELATDCDSDPCLNDGVCEVTANGFVCTCAKGFTGDTCSDQVTDSPLNLNVIIMGSLVILLMVTLCVLSSLICHVMRERSRTKEDYESMLANEQTITGSEWKDAALSVAKKRLNALTCGAICLPCFARLNDEAETDALVQQHVAKIRPGVSIGPAAVTSDLLRQQRKSIFYPAPRESQLSKASSGPQRAGSMTSRAAGSKHSIPGLKSVSQHSSHRSRSLEPSHTSRKARSAGSVPRSTSHQKVESSRSLPDKRSMSMSSQGRSLISRSSDGQRPISLGQIIGKTDKANIKAKANSRKSAGAYGRDSNSPSRDSTRMTLSGGSGFTSGASVCSSRRSASPSRLSRSPSPPRPSPKIRPTPQTRVPATPDSSPQSDSDPEY